MKNFDDIHACMHGWLVGSSPRKKNEREKFLGYIIQMKRATRTATITKP